MRALGGAAPILLLWALPLLASLAMLLPSLADADAWRMALAHPQAWPGLALSLASGGAATVLALGATILLLAGLFRTAAWLRVQAFAATGLAVPHLAFAIGLGFLVMPSGLFARLLAAGGPPPQWVSVQDPWGITLSLALALKEIPFLLTAAAAVLARGDAGPRLQAELRAAASLGHARGSAFLRIALPQLLTALAWPLVIVFVYGATVVDMALVLGPTQPPTLAVVIWHALNDVDPLANRMGLALTLLLTVSLALLLAGALVIARALRGPWHHALTAGPSSLVAPRRLAAVFGLAALAVMGLAVMVLVLLSVSSRWPWPQLLPPMFEDGAWLSLAAMPAPLGLSLGLAGLVAAASVGLAVLWFETQPARRDGWLLAIALLALALPQLATAGGQYRLFLALGLTASLPGLFLAHLTPALAYVLVVLRGPYRAFDARYVQAARSLSVPRLRAVARIKLPLLRAPLLTAAAIGFAVAIAQFVPAQLIAAGRYSTLPMEAVALASGGSRPLTAAYALALTVPPLLGFLAAAALGRPRWR